MCGAEVCMYVSACACVYLTVCVCVCVGVCGRVSEISLATKESVCVVEKELKKKGDGVAANWWRRDKKKSRELERARGIGAVGKREMMPSRRAYWVETTKEGRR